MPQKILEWVSAQKKELIHQSDMTRKVLLLKHSDTGDELSFARGAEEVAIGTNDFTSTDGCHRIAF